MHVDEPEQRIYWNAYPAVWLALCLGAGIVVADRFSGLTFLEWMALSLSGITLALLLTDSTRRIRRRHPLLRAMVVGLIAFSTGAASFRLEHTSSPDDFAHLLPPAESYENITFTGRVTERPSSGLATLRFTFSVREIAYGPAERKAGGRLLVVISRPSHDHAGTLTDIREGDILRITGRLRPIASPRNPAEFDYRRYLALKGIQYRLSVSDSASITSLKPERSAFEALLLASQQHALSQFDTHIASDHERALVSALVLGDRSVMDEEIRADFRRTGLTHLLAISGAHMVVIGLVLYRLLGPLLVRLCVGWRTMEISRFVLTTAVLVFYTLLTGASASAARAAVMVMLFMGGTLLQRSSPPMNTLGVAAIVLMIIDPASLYDLGFQLSFAAVAGLVLLHPVFLSAVPERWRNVAPVRAAAMAVSVSLAATVATAPILLYHFGYVPLAGLALNIIAVPISSILLISGVLTILSVSIVPAVTGLFGTASEGIAYLMLLIARIGDDALSWATLRLQIETVWEVAALCTGIAALVAWPYGPLRWRISLATLFLAAGGLWSAVLEGSARPRLDVLFFDVGQGDAALVSMPNGRHLLIDAGLRNQWSDAGERVILPHLERYDINYLDALLITHPHSDHLGGVPAILRSVPVHRFIHNGDDYTSDLHAETKRLVDSLHIVEKHVRSGDTLHLDPDVHLSILAPSDEAVDGHDVNEASVVVRIAYGETTFLLLGDADVDAEREMLRRWEALLRSDVVKVGHHGSSTSSDATFIDRVLPDVGTPSSAIVSVGRNNVYGLPDSSVLDRWQSRGAYVWATSQEGAIWLSSDGATVRRIDWR